MDIYILNDHFFITTDPESFLKDPAVSKYLYEGISIAKVMFNENGVSLQNFKHVANYKNGKWIFIE